MNYIARGDTVYTITETQDETIIDIHDRQSNYIGTIVVNREEYRK